VSFRGVGRAAVASAALLATRPDVARAQRQRVPVAPEVRLDVLGGRPASVQGAVGVTIPSGTYVRIGVLAGVGPSVERGGPSGAAGRLDVLARFLLDPFRQSRWGVSAGAGVSLRADPGDRVRPRLLAVLDVEGRRTGRGFTPALQIGLGGGVRGGIGLRWSDRRAR
jgi:hypothetical protein